MRMLFASMASILGMLLLAVQAQAQFPPTGAETSYVQACFYECKPGPLVQGLRTYREITTLMATNNGRFATRAQVYFLDGNERVIAQTQLELSPLDLDELQVCATIERITGAAPPEAGLIEILDLERLGQGRPSGVFAFIKNLGGKFFAVRPEPFDGRVVGVAKTQCKYVPAPEVIDVDTLFSAGTNAPEGEPILVENTFDEPVIEPPDLLPVPDPQPGIGFCRIDPTSGDLEVQVRNQGAGAAGPTTTQVDFTTSSGVSSSTRATPGLAPGGSTILDFQFPLGCFIPDCQFRITVDSNGVEAESNEANNTGTGFCLG